MDVRRTYMPGPWPPHMHACAHTLPKSPRHPHMQMGAGCKGAHTLPTLPRACCCANVNWCTTSTSTGIPVGDVGGEGCSDDAISEGRRSKNDGTRAPRMADSRGVVGLLAHRQGDEFVECEHVLYCC